MKNLKSGQTNIVIADIGLRTVSEADKIMQHLAGLRYHNDVPDMLLIMAHEPCLALGAREANPADFLMPLEYFESREISLYKSIRGGGLTYHWPGQLICYPVLKLMEHEQNIPRYIFRLEEVVLRTLASLGVRAGRKRDKAAQIGLWVNQSKIASMGVSISRWITNYGFAINLSGDFSPAQYIRPCGLENVSLTSVNEITGLKSDRKNAVDKLLIHFSDVFDREVMSDLGKSAVYDVIENMAHADSASASSFQLRQESYEAA